TFTGAWVAPRRRRERPVRPGRPCVLSQAPRPVGGPAGSLGKTLAPTAGAARGDGLGQLSAAGGCDSSQPRAPGTRNGENSPSTPHRSSSPADGDWLSMDRSPDRPRTGRTTAGELRG